MKSTNHYIIFRDLKLKDFQEYFKEITKIYWVTDLNMIILNSK